MRVAMIGLRAPWGAEGGVECSVGELAPRLVAQGCEVTVLCRRRYNHLGQATHKGVRLVDVDTVYTKHLEAFVHTGAALPRAITEADVIHVHATGPALWSWLPRLAGRAVVVTVHGLDWRRDKWGPAAREVLRLGAWAAGRFPHQVITVSRELTRHYREHYGVSATWVPNGVAPIVPVPLSNSGVGGLEPGRFLLLLGRLVPEKGVKELLAAWGDAELAEPLVVVGGSSYSDGYVDHLKRLASPGVYFAGPLFGPARDALLTHARALVLPSRMEGFPLAPLESLSAGRPVLLSDIPPHRELLDGVDAGWLVPASHDGWVTALRDLTARSDQDLAALGAAGRAHVRAHFTWDQVARRTMSVYRAALEQRS